MFRTPTSERQPWRVSNLRRAWARSVGASAVALGLVFGMGLPTWTDSVAFAQEASPAAPLMKLLKSGKLPAERQATVVEMICKRGNGEDLAYVAEQLAKPDGFAAEQRVKVAGWLAEATQTRKVVPAGDVSSIGELMTSDDASLQQAAIRLAALWKVKGVASKLEALLAKPQTSSALQRAAIDGLVAIDDEASHTTLQKLAEGSGPLKLRMLAAAGWAKRDSATAASAAASILAASSGSDSIEPLLDAFLGRKTGADELAGALAGKKVAADTAKMALRYMYSIGRSDAALSNFLSEAAGIAADPPLPSQEEVAKIAAEVQEKGDAARGEKVFRSKSVSCFKCHALSQAGGNVGPELSALGSISPVDYVVNSILNPNLAIKEQFVTKTIITSDGNVVTGVVVDRDPTRVRLKDATGNILIIPTDDIETEAEGKSLMPQGLTKFLTHQETLDLMKFVSLLGKPGPYAIRKAETMQRWRVLREPAAEVLKEVPNVEIVRAKILELPAESWDPAYAQVAGEFPLDEVKPAEGPAVVILQGEVDVTEEGSFQVDIKTKEKFQVWFDAEPFGDSAQFEVNGTKGVHKITLRMEISDASDPAVRLELVRLTGSSAQFVAVAGK
ncbi:MAG: hypothetical protein ACO1RA_02800 [Planctomycetaceae bacterium]